MANRKVPIILAGIVLSINGIFGYGLVKGVDIIKMPWWYAVFNLVLGFILIMIVEKVQ